MFQKILVGYDGSEAANKAFTLALDLAERYQASIRVLSVAQPPEFGEEVETEAVLENSRKHYHHVHKPLKQLVAGHNVHVDYEVAIGHPAERIIIEAERWGADLIIIGHRGRGVMQRWLLGSMAKQIMNHATCSVLLAR